MKTKAIIVICVNLSALCILADNKEYTYEHMIMPEVNIRPLKSQSKESFALRAKNITAKDLFETLCFLSNRNNSFSNGIIKVNEYSRKDLSSVESTHKKDILKLADEIIIPEATMRPPATIVDAVDFLYQASQDYDDPEKEKSKRGINFAVKSPEIIKGFENEKKKDNRPQICSHGGFQSVLKAIKHICKSTNTKFIVYGKTIVFLPDKNKK